MTQLQLFQVEVGHCPSVAGRRGPGRICMYLSIFYFICMYLSAFFCLGKKCISDKPLLPAGYCFSHPPKHVRKRGLLLSCDHDSEHQTKSTPYHIISRYTKQIQTETNTYIHVKTHTSRYIQIHTVSYTCRGMARRRDRCFPVDACHRDGQPGRLGPGASSSGP